MTRFGTGSTGRSSGVERAGSCWGDGSGLITGPAYDLAFRQGVARRPFGNVYGRWYGNGVAVGFTYGFGYGLNHCGLWGNTYIRRLDDVWRRL